MNERSDKHQITEEIVSLIKQAISDNRGSKANFCRDSGIKPYNLSKILNGSKRFVFGDDWNRLCNYFPEIDDRSDKTSEVRAASNDDMYRVPVFGMAAAAEIGRASMPLTEYAAQNADDFVSFPNAKPGDFSLVVSGNSMTPWYPNGTRLLVRPTQRPHDGERVVAVLSGGEVVFKIFVEGKETYALVSINASGKSYTFDKMEFGAVRSIFSVVASYRIEADLDAAMGAAGIRHYWEKVKEGLK